MSLRLKNKICVITGAGRSGGINQGIGDVFAKNGGKLILLDILPINHNSLSKTLQSATIMTIECDVSSEQSIINAMKLIKNKLGNDKCIDVLVNGAALFIMKHITEASNEDWTNMLSVNVKGYALTMKNAIPMMRARGSIINIASISGFRAQIVNQTIYNSTKAAIVQMSKNVALDVWDKYKIRVNTISPGIISTALLYDHVNKLIDEGQMKSFEEWFKYFEKYLIIKELGKVEDVGNAALFFASDESKYCTGCNLMVDGGWSAL
eukprot:368215_1